MTQMKPTYHLPPNFSIPPDGPFQLGTVIRDFNRHAKMRPFNQSRKSRIEIPPGNIYTDHKSGFEATRARLKAGELGIWAKFVGVDGVGAEAKVSAERSENDVYKFENVETTFFYPESTYVSKSMELSDVKDYLSATDYKKPVFLVTGLKVANGISVQHNKSTQVAAVANVGINNPEVVGVQAGPGASFGVENSPGYSFSSSSDIVVGIQCSKVYYKASWLGGGRKLKEEMYLTGAVFHDDDSDNFDSPEFDNHVNAEEDDFDQSTNELVFETAVGRREPWLVPKEVSSEAEY